MSSAGTRPSASASTQSVPSKPSRSPTLHETVVWRVTRPTPAAFSTVGNEAMSFISLKWRRSHGCTQPRLLRCLAGVDRAKARDGAVAHQGQAAVPADADARGVLRLQLAHVDHLERAVLQPD